MAQLGHIVIKVSDFSACEDFYDQILFMMSFEVAYRVEQPTPVKCYSNGYQQIVLKYQSATSFEQEGSLDHMALHVKRRIEVQQLYELVKNLAVPCLSAPQVKEESGISYYGFRFEDPEGFCWEIATLE